RFLQNATEKRERLEHIRAIIKKQIKKDVSDQELWEFFKVLDLLHFDFDINHGKDTSSILTHIQQFLVTSDENAKNVWNQICSEVGKHNQNSGTITRESLSRDLVCKFIRKTTVPSFWRVPPFNLQNFV